MEEKKEDKLKVGVYVFITLLLLTLVEYGVAVMTPISLLALLAILGLSKAVVIIVYYMHIGGIFSTEGGNH